MPSGACCGNSANNHHTIQLITKESAMSQTIQTNVNVSGMT